MDRHPRGAHWEEGYKKFYDDDANEIEGNEWRLVTGHTPITNEPCHLLYEADDLPDDFQVDGMNSNESFTTWVDKNGVKYTYAHQENEIREPWAS